DPAHAPARPFYLRAPDVKPPAGAAPELAHTAASS
ncbi:MAG: tRNA (adenosine(37)-N6)-threonylcarbamoyltransferase complex dimerization subunit type 1 TsaB, partial [Bradyrhizobium sp.]